MEARGTGQILEVSSVLGFFGIRDSAVYAASKHAVNGLVKSLRNELHGTGVRVWAACPERTASEFRQVALAERGAERWAGYRWANQPRKLCGRFCAGSIAGRRSSCRAGGRG